MPIYRYPPKAVVGDYVRSLAGLAVGIGVLTQASLSNTVTVIFGLLTVIFLLFALRTVQRHLTRIAVSDEGLFRRDLFSQSLPWTDLTKLRLRYFGTRRQHGGGNGFLQLTLQGHGRAMKIESDIEGFQDIARLAARAARDRSVGIDPTTAGNLLAIGIDPDGEPLPAEAGRAWGDKESGMGI